MHHLPEWKTYNAGSIGAQAVRAPNPLVPSPPTPVPVDRDAKAITWEVNARVRKQEESKAKVRAGLDRQMEEKMERLRRQKAEEAKEKRHVDLTAAREERMFQDDRRAYRQHHLQEQIAGQQQLHEQKHQDKVQKDIEDKRIRKSLAQMAKRDPDRETRDHALRRLAVANQQQEACYSMYQRSIGNPEQARLDLEKTRLGQDETDREQMASAYFGSREDARRRQYQEMAQTLAGQVKEKNVIAEEAAAQKKMEKHLVTLQVHRAMETDMKKHFAIRARDVQFREDLAATIAERAAMHKGHGSQIPPALATMHLSPELSRDLNASKLLDKPMGRPLPETPSWVTRDSDAVSVPNLQANVRPLPPGYQAGMIKVRSEPGLGSARIGGGTRAGAKPQLVGTGWSTTLSPEAKRAALEVARRREAAALTQLKGL